MLYSSATLYICYIWVIYQKIILYVGAQLLYFDKIGIISVSLFKRLNKRGKESMNAKQRVGFGFLGARVACCSLTACPTFLRGLPNFFMYVQCTLPNVKELEPIKIELRSSSKNMDQKHVRGTVLLIRSSCPPLYLSLLSCTDGRRGPTGL